MSSPADELAGLFEQWRSLTEDEGRAIEGGAWTQVEQYQTAKTLLQPRITELSARIEIVVHETRFRAVVEELMELERRNLAILQRQRESAEQRRQELDRASRNLRQIHKTYVPSTRAHWQSYS